MFDLTQARVSARALTRATALATAIGVGLGGACLASVMVKGGLSQARADHLTSAAARGFTEAALRAQIDAMAPGALAIAKRHDPYMVAGDDARDRDAALLAARLERTAAARSATVRRADPGAEPFRLGGALDGARELECLTQAVYYEARGEGAAGQAAVAQVVLNRVRHAAFPNSVCGVVFQGASAGRSCQFSFACDGSVRRRREAGAWRRAQKVAASALDGRVVAELGAATHFHASRVSPSWGNLVRVASVGQHVFYRFGGKAGSPGAFRQRNRPAAEAKTVYAGMLPTQIAPAPQFLSLGVARDEATEAAKPAGVAAESVGAAEATPAPVTAPAKAVVGARGPAA